MYTCTWCCTCIVWCADYKKVVYDQMSTSENPRHTLCLQYFRHSSTAWANTEDNSMFIESLGGRRGQVMLVIVLFILQQRLYRKFHTPIPVSKIFYTPIPILQFSMQWHIYTTKEPLVSPVHTFQNLCEILIHTNIHTAMHPYLHHHIPIEAAIDAGCISSLADLVSVHYQDGCTDKEVEGELKIHHPSSWPHLSPCGKVGKAQ